MKLILGTDSTWSLRAWICSQLAQVKSDLVVINLSRANYKSEILKHSSTGLVPALNEGSVVIHDSLAIAEYLNEVSNGSLYPNVPLERALARSYCAELHSGFFNIRALCPFTLEQVASLTDFDEKTKAELMRIESIFAAAHLPFMFNSAGAVDAYYAILAFRLNAYGINLTGKAGDYQKSLLDWPILQQAITLAGEWHKA